MNKAPTLTTRRDRIAATKTQRQAVADAPRARAESRSDIDAQCLRWAQEGAERIGHKVGMVAFGSRIDDLFRVRPVNDLVDLGPVLAHLLTPERLAAILAQHLERHADGPTAAERVAQVAQMDRDLFDLECAEEAHIEQLEATGLSISRRADADPRAVLGLPFDRVTTAAAAEASDPTIRSTPHVAQTGRVAQSSYVASRRE